MIDESINDIYFFAELWFRFSTQQVEHKRVRSQLKSTILAPIIALKSIILSIEAYFFARFVKFLRIQSVIRHVYNLGTYLEESETQIDLGRKKARSPGICYLFFCIYMKGQSGLSRRLNKNCCMSKWQRIFNKNYFIYKAMLKKDLNLKKMMIKPLFMEKIMEFKKEK